MNNNNIRHKGSCLCGQVIYELAGNLRPVICCHCTQCRKHTGHYFAATAVALPDLVLIKADGLRWHRSSKTARRGFCGNCGSSLFWRREEAAYVAVAAGTIDGPTGLAISAHIHCATAGDYYDLPEDVPCLLDGADLELLKID